MCGRLFSQCVFIFTVYIGMSMVRNLSLSFPLCSWLANWLWVSNANDEVSEDQFPENEECCWLNRSHLFEGGAPFRFMLVYQPATVTYLHIWYNKPSRYACYKLSADLADYGALPCTGWYQLFFRCSLPFDKKSGHQRYGLYPTRVDLTSSPFLGVYSIGLPQWPYVIPSGIFT